MSITQFVTPAALLAEFGAREMTDLTDIEDPQTGAMVVAVAQRACERADAEILLSLQARYTLPLPSIPQALCNVALDLAHFYLYQHEPPTWVQTRFDNARATLAAISSGKLPLGVDGGGDTVAQQVSNLPVLDGGSKVFGRGDW